MADADFRPAQASDWSQIQRMCRDLYVEDVVGETMDDGKILRTLAHLVAHPDQGQAWVVVVDGRALGYAILIWFWSNEYGGLLGVVDEIWVEPEARGLGIGSGFLKALQRSRDDLVGLDLEVSPENTHARGWYARRGFVPIRNQMLRWRPDRADRHLDSVMGASS